MTRHGEPSFFARASGATAGAVLSTVTLSPLEVVKTRAHVATVNSGLWQTLRNIAQKEGVRALYRGCGPTLLLNVPRTVIYLSCFDHLCGFGGGAKDSGLQLLAGCSARALATATVAPIELLSTRLRAESGGGTRLFGRALAQLRSECAQGGVSAAFRGLVPTLLTDVPFSGMMLVLYGHMRDALRAGRGRFPGGGRESATTQLVDAAAASAGAGALAALLTAPCDLLKTRRQVTGGHATTSAAALVSDARDLVRARGPRALLAGAGARMAKVTPANAIIVTCFEASKLALGAT